MSAFALILLVLVPLAAKGQSATLDGWISVVWDVNPSPTNPDGVAVFVVAADGRSTILTAQPEVLRDLVRLDRRFVRVAIENVVPRGFPRMQAARATSVRSLSPGLSSSISSSAVTQRPFITVLCRYQDDESTPTSIAAMESVVGGAYPAAGHYFGELAQDPAVMSGNQTVGWFTLPRPRSAYIRGDTTDFGALVTDCTGAADAAVNFPAWYGVNLQLNGELSKRPTEPFDPLAFGGSWVISRDGQTRVYGVTWMGGSFNRNYVVYPHEMGHALGWPHSSGRYGQEYDSRWDLMSVGYLNFTQQFGWLSVHTIAPHKDQAGWIPAARKWIPAASSSEVREISRTALPGPGASMLMAEIPISGQSAYTVEARRVAGYDTPLPGEAVLIHRVDNGRAYVVDPDENGNPNDAAAMWTPGETFSDPVIQLTVTVESATATGFMVRITRGASSLTIAGPAERRQGVVNVQYADTSSVQGAAAPPVWSVSSGQLPPGLTLASASGVISGVPSSSGIFSFILRAIAGGSTASRQSIIRIADPLSLLASGLRKTGGVASTYADTLRASGGSGSYSWRILSGSLPPGLTLGAQTGIVAGIPTDPGTFQFAAEVASTVGNISLATSQSLSMTVIAALAQERVLDQLLGAGSLTEAELAFLDAGGNRNSRFDLGDVRAWLIQTGRLTNAQAGNDAADLIRMLKSTDTTGARDRPKKEMQ